MIELIKVPRIHSRKRIQMAMDFFAERLMGARLADKVDIEVVFVKNLLDKTGNYGSTCWEDRPDRSREFSILIERDLSDNLLLRTLAHEMVHVKQHAKGELRCSLRHANLNRWKGETIDDDKVKYRDLPWEKEAFSMERPLVKEFKEYEARASEA